MLVIISTFATIPACQKNTISSCDAQLPQLLNPVPFSILSDTGTASDGIRVCTTKEAEWGPEYGEVMSLDPQGGVIHPLAILNYNSFKDGAYIPIVGDRKPAIISISLSNITGKVAEKIEEPSLSSVREATQKILQSKTGSGTAAKISWRQSQIYSENHFRLSVGGNYGNLWADISAQYEYKNNEVISRFLFQFTQEYYSIDVDAPQPGMQNFFEQEINCSQAGGLSPVWVSSVKYGRKVFLMIESKSYDYSHMGEIQASFDGFLASGGVTVETTLSKLMQEKSIKGVIIGGPAYQGIKAITSTAGLKEYLLAGANFNENSPGVPLSYTLRFVNDNSIAKLVMYDKFTIRDCKIIPAIPATPFEFQPGSISEIRLIHTKGDKEFSGNGPKVTLKTTLSLSSNNKEVWAKIDLTMVENGGDNTTGSRTGRDSYDVKLWTCPSGKKITQITSSGFQQVNYTDTDIFLDKYDFDVNNVIKHVEFRGDTDGDDLDLSDIESTGHLHTLTFNKVTVGLTNE